MWYTHREVHRRFLKVRGFREQIPGTFEKIKKVRKKTKKKTKRKTGYGEEAGR